MINKNFIPQDYDLLQWLKNFSEQISHIGKSLGISPAEVASIKALILDVKNDLKKGRDSKECQAKRKTMLEFVQKIIHKMRIHPSYNQQEHGEKLKIVD
jgi:hypothetical protein